MGCGSSRVSASVTIKSHQNGSMKRQMEDNVTTDYQTKDSDALENMESYNGPNKLSSGCMENFRRKKQNLIPSLDMFGGVDQKSVEVPITSALNLRILVEYLTSSYDTDLLRLRALWIWVTHNISYDTNSFFNPDKTIGGIAGATDVLTNGLAVCSGYANLMKELAEIAGIKMEQISGWAKGFSYVTGVKLNGTEVNHAWNVVLLNDTWWLLDPTWGAGYIDSNKNFVYEYSEHYFLTDPNQFIYDHLPTTPDWQLLEHPVTMETYEGYLKLTKHFFRLRIKPVTNFYGVIDCETGKLHVKFRLNKEVPVKCTGKLLEENNSSAEATDKYLHIYSTEKTLHVLVDVPKTGDFQLKLFAENLKEAEKDSSSLPMICSYFIKCTEKLGKASEFPKQFRKWSPGFHLHSPIEGVLRVGQTYKFRISLPGITDMAVCLGGKISKWEHLENTSDVLWEGELTLPDGTQRVNIVARRKENSPFSSVLEYKVIDKDW